MGLKSKAQTHTKMEQKQPLVDQRTEMCELAMCEVFQVKKYLFI